MMRRVALWTSLAFASLVGSTARAADGPGYLPGPWHFRSVSCVDTTVSAVDPRLVDAGEHAPYSQDDFKNSGVVVTFASGLGMRPVFAKAFATVVHYQGDGGNDVMVAEKPGDRVQLCFLGGPAPQAGATAAIGCNPDTDPRGRQYRVWDYAQNKQYAGFNSEHLCGGA